MAQPDTDAQAREDAAWTVFVQRLNLGHETFEMSETIRHAGLAQKPAKYDRGLLELLERRTDFFGSSFWRACFFF